MTTLIRFLLISALASAAFAETIGEKYYLRLFDFNQEFHDCDDPSKPCYTVKEMVQRSLRHGPNARLERQILYQAQQQVKVQKGNILPQLNVLNGIDAIISPGFVFDYLIPLIGAVFPNRWQNLKASKHLREAEVENLKAVYGNLALNVQQTYYDVQQQLWLIRVMEFYIHQIDELIEFFREQKCQAPKCGDHRRPGDDRRATDENIGTLLNIKGEWLRQLAFTNNLTASYPLLAQSMGFDPNVDWGYMQVEPHHIISISNFYQPNYNELWKLALPRSPELKSIQHQIEAARHNKTANKFNFIDPSTGVNFGYGYSHNIKIARSAIEALNITLFNTKLQLSVGIIQNALNNIGDAFEALPGVEIALNALSDIREDVQYHINDPTTELDIQRISRHLNYAHDQSINYVTLYFFFKSNQSALDRATWTTDIYDMVQDFLKDEMPKLLQETKKAFTFRTAIKNKWRRFRHKETAPSQEIL